MRPFCVQLSMAIALLSILAPLFVLTKKEVKTGNIISQAPNFYTRNGKNENSFNECLFRIKEDFGIPHPVYLRGNELLKPSSAGYVSLREGEPLTIWCGQERIGFKNRRGWTERHQATVVCAPDNQVHGVISTWPNKDVELANLVCSDSPSYTAEEVSDRSCYNNNTVIQGGYRVAGRFLALYESCFDKRRLEVLYVTYQLDATNVDIVGKVTSPRNFKDEGFYGEVAVEKLYSKREQRKIINRLLGSNMASRYFTSQPFLTRGHYAAKADFIFASAQRATYVYINVAPQFSKFNTENWSTLENNLRERIAIANYNCIIYVGTFGVTQLRDKNNVLTDIYLSKDRNGNQRIPVPQYFYKVAYDPSRRLATAFVGINNPHYGDNELRKLQQNFCNNVCNGIQFTWLKWKSDFASGYSFCCTLEDFRKQVPHLPEFTVDGLLV